SWLVRKVFPLSSGAVRSNRLDFVAAVCFFLISSSKARVFWYIGLGCNPDQLEAETYLWDESLRAPGSQFRLNEFRSRTVKRNVQALRCVGCTTVMLTLFLGFVPAQTSSKEKSNSTTADTERPVATFRAHTDLVLIPVTVTDSLNRFVLGL